MMHNIVAELQKETKPKLKPFYRDANHEDIAYAIGKALEGAFIYHLPFTTICSGIGKKLSKIDKTLNERDQEKLWFRIGFRAIEVLRNHKIVGVSRDTRKDKRAPYMLSAMNDEVIDAILYATSIDLPKTNYASLPQFSKPEPWTGFYHSVAGKLVRNANKGVVSYFTPKVAPKVFAAINRQQNVSYRVNKAVLEAIEASQNDKLFTLEGKRYSEEQKDGIKLQRKAVIDLFTSIGDRPWWEYKFYDFRGRIYSSCNYAGSSSKIAKGLTLLDKGERLGTEGLFWLMIHGANTWGEDKLTLDERYDYAVKHKEQWIEIGKDPVNNKVWQEADSPFEFLAFAVELYQASINGWEDYVSHLIVSLDASNSGSQILAAMLRDRVVGELCNITSKEERGDSYLEIADEIWDSISFDKKDEDVYKRITGDLRALDEKVDVAYQSKDKKALQAANEARVAYLKANKESVWASANVFWGKLKDNRRKICKRGVMTYAYSAGAKCISDQLMEDFYADYEDLNSQFAFFLGLRIYHACRKRLTSPTQLMDLFVELGVEDYKNNEDFGFINPVGFYCLQRYRDDVKARLHCKLGRKEFKVNLVVGKNTKLTYQDIKSGTSPNVVHSLDSALLTAITLKCNYDVVTIHDSFGCLAAHAGKLFEDTRECFREMFGKNDVLADILAQKGREMTLTYGDLDVENESGESEFMFS